MKSLSTTLFVLIATGMQLSSAQAGDKARYDLATGADGRILSLAKTSGSIPDGFEVSRAIGGATLLRSGYFTLGTTGGLSPTGLDKQCGITFGHPYAMTSFPVLSIDGVWGRSTSFFDTDSGTVTGNGDSLAIEYRLRGTCLLRIGVALDNGGGAMRITSTLKNLDTVAHTLGNGIVFDAGLGRQGDGVLAIDRAPVIRDSLISGTSLTGKTIEVRERMASNPGMKIALDFPGGMVDTFIATNWTDDTGGEAPVFKASPLRRLYDLVLKSYWNPSLVAPGDSLTRTLRVTLESPDFGSKVFTRWDLPEFLSVATGDLYPQSIPSFATISNVSGGYLSGLGIAPVLVEGVSTTTPAVSQGLAAGTSASIRYPLTIGPVYQSRILDLLVSVTANGIPVDSCVKTVYLPAVPLVDTGLTVTIDSIITSAFPRVGVVMEVSKTSNKQKMYQLTRDNIFLYENGTRIQDISLGKDTSGGVSAADVVFVLDVTGSMGGIIDGVKAHIKEFADSIRSHGFDLRLGMVTFLDYIENVYPFTTDIDSFKVSVDKQYAHNGGDEPENSLDALFQASLMPYRENAGRIVIWITDATYHVNDGVFTNRTVPQVVDALLAKDIVVNAIGTASREADWYDPIVNATGGKYFDIAGNFRDILLSIGNLGNSARFLMWYTSTPAPPSLRTLQLTVHASALGGSTTKTYTTGSSGLATSAEMLCYPNPFNPQTTFRVMLPERGMGELAIYSLLGQEVRRYQFGPVTGQVSIRWDGADSRGNNVASGVYFARSRITVSSGQIVTTNFVKVIHLK
jgi:Mg-chelatase subunit ChlD